MTGGPDSYLASLFSLAGRVAIVTGGSSGIGEAMAAALAAAGARVVLVARTAQDLQAAAARIEDDGGSAAWVAADLGRRDEVLRAADEAVAHFGEPDVLVNAAGVNLRPPLDELDQATWDRTMAVNLEAAFLLGQRFGPGMAARGFGRIVHVSSQQAHRAFARSGAYGVSKGALEALSRSQAEAWSARGVTSNTVVPGFVLTRLNRELASDPGAVAALAARTMVGRNGLVGDFAGLVVFLASGSSGYLTGQSLFVDGGLSVH